MDVPPTAQLVQPETVFSDPKLPPFHPALVFRAVLLYFHPSFRALEEHLFGVCVPAVPGVFPPALKWLQVFAECLGSHGFGSGSWEGHGVLWKQDSSSAGCKLGGMMI